MNIASYIDHTALKQHTTLEEINQLCAEAIANNFKAVCIPPFYVADAVQLLKDLDVKVSTVIGFPLGYSSINSKLAEIKEAIAAGADELDFVINLCALREGNWAYLEKEIVACLQPVRLNRKIIKIIIESGTIFDNEIINCCNLYAKHKVDFLKTSTGFAEKGAEVYAVSLMRKHLPQEIEIKASGGIRTFAFAKELIEAGATRIGASASIAIINQNT